ncbi:PREDICTED: transcription factor SPT20 homolog [Chrysochloris asiatica]|uniref:Transcription factor SPT20 homolog n=1 Tax=Chrysochloris asiatica TaxID=185453 RepID=A0A9B0T9R7_CHRAS|nr:PREDICTED: transcription factor SPT20 homolog [Chrysochloris asiatica]
MQQSLEDALDSEDDLAESAQQRSPKQKYFSSGKKSIFQKLHDLYVEEFEKEPTSVQELKRNVNLLEKLVLRERLSRLVVKLYPSGGGYTLMFKGGDGSESEAIRLSYEKRELLEYLDAEELPPVLIDFLEKSQMNIFYSGCVIAEVRDYGQCGNMQAPSYQSRHVLLRPTAQTLISDVDRIASNYPKWTQEDKLQLESQLILATAEPLCLDPSVAVACTENRLLYNKQKMNTHPRKQCFDTYSTSSQSEQPELFHCPLSPQLESFTACLETEKRKVSEQNDLEISKAGDCVDMWEQNPCNLAMPSEVNMEKYAKVDKPDALQLNVWAGYEVNDNDLFGCKPGNQYQKTTLSLMQSLDDPLFSGTMQPTKEDEESDRERSPFFFTTDDDPDLIMNKSPKSAAESTVSQYQHLVPKEARCLARKSHSSSGSASLSQLSPRAETEQPQRMLFQSSLWRTQPIALPSSSGSSSAVNYPVPQQASDFLKAATPGPASKPPVPFQKPFANFNRVIILSSAALSPASSSQHTTTKPVMSNSINARNSVRVAQASASDSNPVLDCSSDAKTPAEICQGVCPSLGVPAVVPSGVPAQALTLKNTSANRPLTVLQLPGCQFIFLSQQQQQQHLPQFTPQQPAQRFIIHQQPRAPGSAQSSTSPTQVLPAPQSVLIKLVELQNLAQTPRAVLPHPVSATDTREQSQPQLRVPATSPQQQPPIQPLNISRRPVATAEASTQTDWPYSHRRLHRHKKDKRKISKRKTPRS